MLHIGHYSVATSCQNFNFEIRRDDRQKKKKKKKKKFYERRVYESVDARSLPILGFLSKTNTKKKSSSNKGLKLITLPKIIWRPPLNPSKKKKKNAARSIENYYCLLFENYYCLLKTIIVYFLLFENYCLFFIVRKLLLLYGLSHLISLVRVRHSTGVFHSHPPPGLVQRGIQRTHFNILFSELPSAHTNTRFNVSWRFLSWKL